MATNKIKNWAWSLLLLAYLIVRFFFTHWLDSLGTYSSYILEFTLIAIAFSFDVSQLFSQFKLNKKLCLLALLFAPFGFIVYKLAYVLQIAIPFDLKGTETLFFLLIIAPILEESIFRFFIWTPLEKMHRTLAYFTTSILFSYSHFHAVWFVPEAVQGFIYYQTAYTFLLALACGYSVLRYSSLAGAMLIHFLFNLGFYLASFL